MTIIYFILVLGVTVLIHELGHFIFAKRSGIYVYEFSLGMGPRIFKHTRKGDETEYSIRLFPIGGYVQMAGEEVEVDDNIPREKTLQGKNWPQKIMTVVAGVLFNFILAIVLLFLVGMIKGVPNSKPLIASVEENMGASTVGIQDGDLITKVNNKDIISTDKLSLALLINQGKAIDVEVKRNDQYLSYTITPTESTENGETEYLYGFTLDNSIERGIFESLQYSLTKTISLVDQMASIIGYLFTGKLALNSLSGPVGIYEVVGETAKTGIVNIIYLMAFISINVGFINLLPLPAFDGGRLLFLLIEKLRGKPVEQKVENALHTIGFALLMGLMILVTYNDILKLFK